jgi:hypothetical protein
MNPHVEKTCLIFSFYWNFFLKPPPPDISKNLPEQFSIKIRNYLCLSTQLSPSSSPSANFFALEKAYKNLTTVSLYLLTEVHFIDIALAKPPCKIGSMLIKAMLLHFM